MLSTTQTIIMNKATTHLYCIYITSPLLKKRFGCKLFAIHFYCSSSQYYRTLDNTLAIQLSLHLICFIIRLYSFNSNHLSVFLFCIFLINTTIGWNVHQNVSKITIKQVIFFSIVDIFYLCKTFNKNSNSADLCHLYVLGAKLHQHLHH
jgi:hypothetical protein